MEYIRDRESNIPFSLHDSRILQMDMMGRMTRSLELCVYGIREI